MAFQRINDTNGNNAFFLNNTYSLFQRDYVGVVGTSSFKLVDASGNHVPYSVDPFFFEVDETPSLAHLP